MDLAGRRNGRKYCELLVTCVLLLNSCVSNAYKHSMFVCVLTIQSKELIISFCGDSLCIRQIARVK